jgi:myo-inositol 2-dehydrogenase / D-chiro-inositol 1-dehydrogenase
MARQLGVGIVGVGMLGRRHAHHLAHHIPESRVVAVADARLETAREVAEETSAARVYRTAEELAADSDVEALVIVSSDEAHLAGIMAGAAARKDVFCEKPITPTLEEADRALKAVEASGIRLQIGFMRRYDAAYRAAKEAIERGAIGTPAGYRSAHRDRDPWGPVRPASDGCSPAAFTGSNIHDYDDARWLLADEAKEVWAAGTRVLEATAAEGIDVATTVVRFRRGALATIEYASPSRYGYDVRAEVIGDRGTIFIGDPRGSGCVVATYDGLQYPAMDHWLTRFDDAYLTELTDWVRRTLDGDPPSITGADGRAALEIAVAAQRSMASGEIVSLPLST